MRDIFPANFSCDKDITAGTQKRQYFQIDFIDEFDERLFCSVLKKYIYLHPHFIVKIYQEIIQFQPFHSEFNRTQSLFFKFG